MKKNIIYSAAAITSLLALALPVITNAEGSMGLNPPTGAQRAEMDATMVNTTDVQPNQLGLDRINAERKAKGLPPIPAGMPDVIKQQILQRSQNGEQGQDGDRGRMMGSTTRPAMRGEDGAQRMMGSTTRGMMPTIRREIGEVRKDVVDARSDFRNGRDDMMREGSTSPAMRDMMLRVAEGRGRGDMPPFLTPLMKRMASSSMMLASSTMRERMKDYRQDAKQTRLDTFALRQNNLVEELTKAITNLKQIRARISTKMDASATTSVDFSAARTALTTADSAISSAETAIQALASFTPPTVTSSSIASTTVDLTKPRQIGTDAIKAVNDARKALGDVVRAIAQALGQNLPPSNEPSNQ